MTTWSKVLHVAKVEGTLDTWTLELSCGHTFSIRRALRPRFKLWACRPCSKPRPQFTKPKGVVR